MRKQYCLWCATVVFGFYFSCYSDSIKVGENLYEGVYLQTNPSGYKILFPDGKTLSVSQKEYDPTSLSFSQPLERIKLEEAWKSSPLQKKIVEEEKLKKEQEVAQQVAERRLQQQKEERYRQATIDKANEEQAKQILQDKQEEEHQSRKTMMLVLLVLIVLFVFFIRSKKLRFILLTALTDDAKFSRRLAGLTMSCPDCGATISKKATFCGNCGRVWENRKK